MSGDGTQDLEVEPPAAGSGQDQEAREPDEPLAEPPAVNDESEGRFFVVGVGASADGLDALAALFERVTLDNLAFVIVQHLASGHESLLSGLRARASGVQVVAVEDGMRVEPGHVYVVPPDADAAILQGVLHLMPVSPGHGAHLPVDYFLRSLADDLGAHAIGVVLSGIGIDGTFGLKAVKESGGITFAQELSSARYDGIPRNALESGYADFCLPPEAIADELMAIGKLPYLTRVRTPSARPRDGVNKLLVLMRSAFGHDLTGYKSSTLDRRIERRMALLKIERIDEYLRLVQASPEELRSLYKDMLIGVTSFFRDHDPFEAVKGKILPQILEHKHDGAPVRIWVPACSTGEEAYSFAMCLVEFLDERAQDFRVQIFGTDIDEAAIQKARRGLYPHNISLDVSPERLRRFFIKRDGQYQICRRIRDMVVFSMHNLAKDAPFSRLDLVSCRNLLIYLQPPLQRKVMRILHYAIAPHGYLMLGSSETVGDAAEMFSLIDRKNKLYARKHAAAPGTFDIGFGVQPTEAHRPVPVRAGQRSVADVAALADRKILQLYGPPGVVVNDDLDVIHIRGRTGPYLEPSPGAPSFHLLRLARPELHVDLRRVISEAQARCARLSVESRLVDAGTSRPFKLEAIPVIDPESKTRSTLVLFHEPTAPRELSGDGNGGGSGSGNGNGRFSLDEERQQELEREILLTKEYLQSTIEELESANEELKASNEELQSANEELQSTNEQLETSKEELQAANEELTTVNEELQGRMGELQQTNDDLHNVLAGVANAVVIVGMDLRIRRFTHVAERLLNLVATDVGRPVSQLDYFVLGRRVEELAAQVTEKLVPFEEPVLCADQRWYLLRITPYKTLDHSIRGAVIVLTDDNIRKRAADLGRNIAEYAGHFLTVTTSSLLIVDRRLRVVWVNEPFLRAFQVVAEESIGSQLPLVGTGQWADPRLDALILATLATGKAFRDHVVVFRFPRLGPRSFRVSGSRIPAMGDESVLVLLTFDELPPGSLDDPPARP